MKKRILSCLLAVVLIVGLIPVSAFADDGVTSVTSDAQLRAAVANGGQISIDTSFGFELDAGPIVITKDTTISFNSSLMVQAHYKSDEPDMPIFRVEGASLTLKCEDRWYGGFDYHGWGSPIELIGVEDTSTALTIFGGNYNTHAFTDITTDECGCADSVIAVDNTTENGSVDICIYGGSYYIQNSDYTQGDSLITGSGYTTTVKGGKFRFDPSDVVDNGYVAIKDYDQWFVTALSTEKSEELAALLDEDGKFIVKRFEPDEDQVDMMGYALDALYNSEDSDIYITFYWSSYDITNHTVYASKTTTPWGEVEETHLLELKFVYDKDIKADIDKIADNIPQGEYNEDWEAYEPYYFTVSDLALINYWQTWSEYYDYGYDGYLINDNIENLLLYSEEFKEIIGHKNFSITIGAGDGGPFYNLAIGGGEFKHGDTVYAAKQMGARADQIFYVPEDTADDKLAEALQTRIDEYMGKDVVNVVDKGSLLEYFLQEYYNGMGITQPYEEWKAEFEVSDTYVADAAEIKGLSNDAHYYSVTVNEIEHIFVILKDDDKLKQPEYLNIDAATEVSVSTKEASVPLDTLVAVSAPDEEEQAKLLDKLGADAGESFDISLHSSSLGGNVTKLEDGNFEVSLPVDESLEGLELSVWYLDEKDNATEHPATISNGFASFTTDHFSVYTLASVKKSEAEIGDVNSDGKVDITDLVKLHLEILEGKTDKILDINGDGAGNSDDATALRKIILGV